MGIIWVIGSRFSYFCLVFNDVHRRSTTTTRDSLRHFLTRLFSDEITPPLLAISHFPPLSMLIHNSATIITKHLSRTRLLSFCVCVSKILLVPECEMIVSIKWMISWIFFRVSIPCVLYMLTHCCLKFLKRIQIEMLVSFVVVVVRVHYVFDREKYSSLYTFSFYTQVKTRAVSIFMGAVEDIVVVFCHMKLDEQKIMGRNKGEW